MINDFSSIDTSRSGSEGRGTGTPMQLDRTNNFMKSMQRDGRDTLRARRKHERDE